MRRWLIALMLLIACFSFPGSLGFPAPVAQAQAVDEPKLRDLLIYGLRVRRESDRKFVDRVVEMVEDGELPRSLVQRTFLWARKKPYYPFQYFRRALVIQARDAGIDI
jgi:hypothetical protein